MTHSRLTGIVPPYILSNIIAYGSSRQQACARHTLTHVQTLMAQHHDKSAPAQTADGGQPEREIYDAQRTQNLPGMLVRKEGQAGTNDEAAEEAWRYMGITYDFFWQAWRRNSLDQRGLVLKACVHYGKDYQNAFWNGQQVVFGDGDGEIFNRFTAALDIVAHELAHGVTEMEADLIYFSQSGALNESLSDVFAALTKQFHRGQTAVQADWIIGEGLLAPGINGRGLRSMSEPGTAYDDPLLGKDPQPAHMNEYIQTREDNGGVHLNSGIANRAFYLAARALGGYAWQQAGYVWYDTLCDADLPQDADFATFAQFTAKHAQKRFDQRITRTIEEAWRQVGVLP
ncbi:peptidase M4 family protein [Affinibrenneria salicis]|uniref:Neutral metalloproteinase n=1 Tax=Affinibrenneria salicis TaxID=2590031 RepID=A0A5J5FS79_9GAMM|nr:M4 family metallopeptidase [Affinibrenneria salicis]KAA8995739.1 peptidase M4 family protein [Affinibrenneria salicis]